MAATQLQKRAAVVFFTAALFFGGMMVRLYGLSTGSNLAQTAQSQSRCVFSAAHTRGTIYDCRLRPITNAQTQSVTVAAGTPAAVTALRAQLPKAEAEPVLTQLRAGRLVQIPGVALRTDGTVVFTATERYAQSCAPHLIGYVDESGAGVCGIEQSYDTVLRACSGSVKVEYTADAWGRALAGVPMRVTDTTARSRGGVVLTLDRDIQQMAEQIAADALPAGAIVILDVKTSKIRAMVSTPTYDPAHVSDALTRADAPLLNRALSAYNVGSVFKLVSASCAAERNAVDMTFCCTGSVNYGGRAFRCINGTAHGELNLSGATAVSCNGYFIRLADRLGAPGLLAMARKFGFGQRIALTGELASEAGQLPNLQDLSAPAALANFSFGQGELLATPLQVASMVQTIANDGVRVVPRLAEYTIDENGTPADPLSATRETVISPRAAALVRSYMIEAVQTGTAYAACPQTGGAGAKTATAETGSTTAAGEAVIQAWCAGFYPAESPQYAITVFAENGRSGSAACAPLVARLADGLRALDRVKMENENT